MTGLRVACALVLLADVAAAGLYGGVLAARWRPRDVGVPARDNAADVHLDRCEVSWLGFVTAAGRATNPEPASYRYVVNVNVTDTASGELLEPLQAVTDVGPVDSARWETTGRRPVPAETGVTCQPGHIGRTPTL